MRSFLKRRQGSTSVPGRDFLTRTPPRPKPTPEPRGRKMDFVTADPRKTRTSAEETGATEEGTVSTAQVTGPVTAETPGKEV